MHIAASCQLRARATPTAKALSRIAGIITDRTDQNGLKKKLIRGIRVHPEIRGESVAFDFASVWKPTGYQLYAKSASVEKVLRVACFLFVSCYFPESFLNNQLSLSLTDA